jgi:hypothetical protein
MATELKHTVAPSGGDFTSLAAAIDHLVANHANLVSADVYATIEISGTWSSADTTPVDITDITTDATRYINIYTTGAARHAGVWSTNKYNLSSTADEAHSIRISIGHVRLNGLQVAVTSHVERTDYLYGIRIQGGVGYNLIANCIIVGKSGGSNGNGVAVIAGDVQTLYNNIVYNFSGTGKGGIRVDNETGDQFCYIYNNTVYNCTTGITTDRWQKHTLTNNLVANCTTDFVGQFLSATTNATDGSTAPTAATTSGNRTSQTFTFVGSGNFHLDSTDAGALDHGTSLSGTFTTDIDGETRSGTWDIGADEYVAAGGSTIWKSQRRKFQHLVVR